MDISLYSEIHGNGEPLILLHGNGSNGTYFQYQVGAFAPFYQVITVDTRGHGRSPRGTAPFTMAQFAEDLETLMTEKRIPKAHILGFSDGGNIALKFALRYPERVNRLILNSPNLNTDGVKPSIQKSIETGVSMYQILCEVFTESSIQSGNYAVNGGGAEYQSGKSFSFTDAHIGHRRYRRYDFKRAYGIDLQKLAKCGACVSDGRPLCCTQKSRAVQPRGVGFFTKALNRRDFSKMQLSVDKLSGTLGGFYQTNRLYCFYIKTYHNEVRNMDLAEKISVLRKQNGWSQEELAERMQVTRQSVSKWESGQSVPDLDKVIQLSELFSVRTDFLLKSDAEPVKANTYTQEPSVHPMRRVTLEEANAFLAAKQKTAPRIAAATLLCILSPIGLLLFSAAMEEGIVPLSENAAGSLGMLLLLLFVAVAVAIFITSGGLTKPYAYLDSEPFLADSSVLKMAREQQMQQKKHYTLLNTVGACLCILSLVPLFGMAALTEQVFYLTLGLSAMLAIIGAGVFCFIFAGVNHAAVEKLLQEGGYTQEKKRVQKRAEGISTAYWLLATAVYLAYSFYTNRWDTSWIVWPVAGVLYAALMAVYNTVSKKK